MQVQIGKGIALDVDYERFNAEVLQHVIYMGLRNVLMDSHASHTKDADGDNYVELSRDAAQRKLDSMYAGEVRAVGTREGDPVKAEAVRICVGHVKTAWRKAGRKLSDLDAKVAREKALELLAKNPSIMAQAEKRVAELRAAEVDVSGII